MKAKATDEQIYEFMDSYIVEHGYSPSVRDICGGVGISSTSTMHTRLQRLLFKGMISKGKGARTYRTIPRGEWKTDA